MTKQVEIKKQKYFLQNPAHEDNIQWVIDIIDEYYRPARIEYNIDGMSVYNNREYNNLGDAKADRDIMKCVNCMSCWEYGKVPGEKEYYIYKDFPSIGKTNHKICPECSEWLFNRGDAEGKL
jgi:hypothetical protein|tara:strand:- start:46 stop:411 length:366 start_codon:yes stop_codon:yes gene_type:complete